MGFHLLGSPSTRHVGKRSRGWAVSEGQSQDKQLGGWLNFYTKECLEVKPWPPTLSNQLCQVTVAGKGRRSCTESNERAPDFKKSKAKWVSTLDSGIQIVTVLHHPPRSKSASIADYLESPPSPPPFRQGGLTGQLALYITSHIQPRNSSQHSIQEQTNCLQWSTRGELLVTLHLSGITDKGQSV